MPLEFLIDRMAELPATGALAGDLPSVGSGVGVAGLPGSSPAVLVGALARRFTQRVFVVLTATPTDAERWLADLQALMGPESAALYPQREALGAEEPHVEIAGERIETLEMLLSGVVRVLVTTARASAERTAVPATLREMKLVLASGEQGAGSGSLREGIERLESMGYTRVPTVTEVAQFSVRGGILDVYGFGMAAPARLEWWGDDVASIREFDLDSQRSGDAIERVTILPVKSEGSGTGGGGAQHAAPLQGHSVRQSLLDLRPTDALLLLEQETALGGKWSARGPTPPTTSRSRGGSGRSRRRATRSLSSPRRGARRSVDSPDFPSTRRGPACGSRSRHPKRSTAISNGCAASSRVRRPP